MAQAQEKKYSASRDRLFAAAVRTVSELGYAVTSTDSSAGTISFNTGMSMRSWAGQNITATAITLEDGESKLIVGGKREQKGSIFGGGGQVYDWGEKEKITAKLFAHLDGVVSQTPEPVASQPQQEQSSMAQDLQHLADLRSQGVLSDGEFAAAKAKLLGT
jgi:hypothetical protein